MFCLSTTPSRLGGVEICASLDGVSVCGSAGVGAGGGVGVDFFGEPSKGASVGVEAEAGVSAGAGVAEVGASVNAGADLSPGKRLERGWGYHSWHGLHGSLEAAFGTRKRCSFPSHSHCFTRHLSFSDSWRGSEKCDSRLSAGVEATATVGDVDIASVGANTKDGFTSSLGPGNMGEEDLGAPRGETDVYESKGGKGGKGKFGVKAEASAGVKGCIGTGSR